MSELLYMNKYKYDVAQYGTVVSISLIAACGYCIYSSNTALLSIILLILLVVIVYSAHTSYSLKKDIELQYLVYTGYHKGYDSGSDNGSDNVSDSGSDISSVSSDPNTCDSEKTEIQNHFKSPVISRKLSTSQYYKKFK